MWLGAFALFVTSLGYGIVVPLLPALVGLTDAQDAHALSLVFASFSATKIAAQLPGGVLADRVGARRVLAASLVIFTASMAGLMVHGGVAWFALMRALEGASAGLCQPAVFALALEDAEEETTGRSLGATAGLGMSGLLVGPVLGAWLAPRGVRVPVGVAVAASAVAALVALARMRTPHRRASSAAPARFRDDMANIAALARDLAFLGMAAPIAFNKLTYSALQAIIPLHGATELAMPTREVMIVFGLIGVTFGVAQPIGGALSDRIEPRKIVVALIPGVLFSLALLTRATTFRAFAIGCVVYSITASTIFAATMKLASREYGAEKGQGSTFGAIATLTDLMTVVGPLVFLNVYARLGRFTFAAMALACVPFAAVFWRWGPRPRARA